MEKIANLINEDVKLSMYEWKKPKGSTKISKNVETGDSNFKRVIVVEEPTQEVVRIIDATEVELKSWFNLCVDMIQKEPDPDSKVTGRLHIIGELYDLYFDALAVDFLKMKSGYKWNEKSNKELVAKIVERSNGNITLGSIEKVEKPHAEIPISILQKVSDTPYANIRIVSDPRVSRNAIFNLPVNFTKEEVNALKEKYPNKNVLAAAPLEFKRYTNDKVPKTFHYHEAGYTLSQMKQLLKIPKKNLAKIDQYPMFELVHNILPRAISWQFKQCDFWYSKAMEILEVAKFKGIEIESNHLEYQP